LINVISIGKIKIIGLLFWKNALCKISEISAPAEKRLLIFALNKINAQR